MAACQPDAAHYRGLCGLHVAVIRRERKPYQQGLAVVARDPLALVLRPYSASLAVRSRCAPKHLHHHDYAAIGAAFYYFTNQNWPIFGAYRINTVATPHSWA